MQPPLLIANPACGVRNTARALPAVLAALRQALGEVVVRYTTRRGHARELAFAGTRAGYPLLVALGGDGTFSEVVDGLLAARDDSSFNDPTRGARPASTPHATANGPAVGLINLGTGGDFRRTLGIAPGVEGCVEALASGRERTVDVGRAVFTSSSGKRTTRYFVNVLSAGLGGLVDRYIETMPAILGGRAGYYLAALRAVLVSKERPLLAQITWEGTTREEVIPAYLVAVCNGRWFGGGMDIAPMALPDDGRLEVLTMTAPSKLYLARRVQSVYTGRHLQEPTVHHFPCQRIEIRIEDSSAESLCLLDVDGDHLGSLPLVVEVAPGRLRVRA